MEQLTALRSLFKFHSGRVIALGRVMLAITLFLVVMVGRSQAELTQTYPFLVLYAAGAGIIAVATWKNWWLDARLAILTHAIDMAVFTGLAFSSTGASSPFVLFFILPLLSAAVRWSWRETALTAAVLIALFTIGAFLLSATEGFELQRFVLRGANLVIVTLLLIWFGVHQRFARTFFRVEDFEVAVREGENPLARSLAFAMRASQAASGALIVGPVGEEASDGFVAASGHGRNFTAERPLVRQFRQGGDIALLFDVGAGRALTRPPEGHFLFLNASAAIDMDEARDLGLTTGVIAEISTGAHHGWLVLWDVPELSTDFLDFGRELARTVGGTLDRYALLEAIEVGAAVRTRLSLARDVHDSIVQFLAGAAFRIEAIKRSALSGAAVDGDLDELKRLFVEEQSEIRGFVMALRQHRDLELAEAVAELRALADRLGQQWSVDCTVAAEGDEAPIPIRLQLDLQQLLREAVANAVRHGGADRIDVGLSVADGNVRLSVADNGSGFAPANGAAAEPWSLKERVERAHGSIRLDSAPGATSILISLPLRGAAA
ncbi:sensor histidine kinase [Sphingomonas sp.]|uniref:sensor histidine kinase n=1 Tax=Sphingomonas sp. TaxID=28214 RepID=UPI0038AAA6F4